MRLPAYPAVCMHHYWLTDWHWKSISRGSKKNESTTFHSELAQPQYTEPERGRSMWVSTARSPVLGSMQVSRHGIHSTPGQQQLKGQPRIFFKNVTNCCWYLLCASFPAGAKTPSSLANQIAAWICGITTTTTTTHTHTHTHTHTRHQFDYAPKIYSRD